MNNDQFFLFGNIGVVHASTFKGLVEPHLKVFGRIENVRQKKVQECPVVLRGRSRYAFVSIRVHGHEQCENMHDEDGLQNPCSLSVIKIGPVHHEK